MYHIGRDLVSQFQITLRAHADWSGHTNVFKPSLTWSRLYLNQVRRARYMLTIDLDRGTVFASDPRYEGHSACTVVVVLATDFCLRWAFDGQTETA